ncbi:MAG TPA: hypothetical protein VNE18_13200, partial [Rhodanobacter sp.]|nr:hypothetical protein [Rhodanobacter sp.]
DARADGGGLAGHTGNRVIHSGRSPFLLEQVAPVPQLPALVAARSSINKKAGTLAGTGLSFCALAPDQKV